MLLSGTILQNRYLIKDRIGEGGMGAVYRALDQEFDTIVAVKETLCDDTAMREQFKREATILYKLRHPSLPCVTNHFSEGTGQFLVMDYVEGEDLMALLTRNHGPIPVNQVITWAEELLDTIEYLHLEKIIHRDLKPQNIKQTLKGNIMLLDFGLAKLQHTFSLGSASIHAATLSYAPLEQIRGYGTGPRSDIYSLAATLYHLITNEIPKNAEVREAVLDHGAPDPLKPAHVHNPDVPIGFSKALQQAMALHAETRPDNIDEFRKLLFADQAAEQTKIGRKVSASLAANDRSGYTTVPALPDTGEADRPIRMGAKKPEAKVGQATPPTSNKKRKVILSMVGAFVLAITALLIFRPFPLPGFQGKGIAAIVNGRRISLKELDREFRLETAGQTTLLTGDALENARKAALDELIGKELMFQIAVENKIRVTDMEIDQAVDRQKLESGLSEEQWEMRNRDQGMSEGDIHEEMRRTLTIQQMERKIASNIKNPTERDIDDYYDHNPAKFKLHPAINIGMIVVDPKDNKTKNDAIGDKAAKEKIDDLSLHLKNGSDFSTLAREQSEHESRARAGDLGWTDQDQVLEVFGPELFNHLFRMNEGQTTEPVQIKGNWVIFKVFAKRTTELQLAKDDAYVRQQVSQILLNDRQKAAIAEAKAEVLKRADIINFLKRPQ
jgi:serine/threonine protein kinase